MPSVDTPSKWPPWCPTCRCPGTDTEFVRELYGTMTTEQLLELRTAFELDLADHHLRGGDRAPNAVAFCRQRIEAIVQVLWEKFKCRVCHGSGQQKCDYLGCGDSRDHNCTAGRCSGCFGTGRMPREGKGP